MKIIGAGFGRTGTNSLKEALEILGLRCYHGTTVVYSKDHLKWWVDFGEGRFVPSEKDWKKLFSNHDAAVDWPVSHNYKTLMEIFPDAKIILTVRDAEKWYSSMLKTLWPTILMLQKYRFVPANDLLYRMVESTHWSEIFGGMIFDRNTAISAFKQHIQEVHSHVPSDRLLVFHPKDGWGPLCEFLECPIPTQSFPFVNDSESFMKRAKTNVRKCTFDYLLPRVLLAASFILMVKYSNIIL